jgi:hypothetical protein
MNDDDDLGGFNPSWMEDGLGLRGEQEQRAPGDLTQWDTNAWTRNLQDPDTSAGRGGACNPGTPPESGTFIFGVVDGTCQWIDTTSCPPPP